MGAQLDLLVFSVREMRNVYNDFGFKLTMGAHLLESNSSGNLTPAVSEAEAILPGYLVVVLSVLMVTLVVVVVAGNALVIMAFIVDKTLRNQSNYFFLNLAISDFLVGELLSLLSLCLFCQFAQMVLLFLLMNDKPLNGLFCTPQKLYNVPTIQL